VWSGDVERGHGRRRPSPARKEGRGRGPSPTPNTIFHDGESTVYDVEHPGHEYHELLVKYY
jgi:hypothetical protein